MAQTNHTIPALFQSLMTRNLLSEEELFFTEDGFVTAAVSLARLLERRDITTFPNDQGEIRQCSKFYDDWYLYTVPDGRSFCCSLFKMREQERDARSPEPADGDTPGVTVSFIRFEEGILLSCLADPASVRRKRLNQEINRVVAAAKQVHDPALKAYFLRPQAQGPYLIADLYVRKIASFAKGGVLPVPEHYTSLPRNHRLSRFLDENNRAAGRTVCDHQSLFFLDPARPSREEALAVLATHTANVSFHCFAAEVQFHAQFLNPLAKLSLLGRSPYASAIRADLTIDDREMAGPEPYHDPDSTLVRQQKIYHPNR